MDTEVMIQVLLMLLVVFVLARLASSVFNRFGVPGLIGEILIGIAIANFVIGDWSLMGALDLENEHSLNREILSVLAELGAIFLLFSVGLETRVKHLMSVGKTAFMVAVLGVMVPFILGYAFILAWDGNSTHAMFIGASMVATSVGITARVIKDMKLTEKKESRIIIGAAVIDDILGMIILAIVVGTAGSNGGGVADIALITVSAVLFVVIILLFCAKCVPKINGYMEKRKAAKLAADPNCKQTTVNKLALAIIVCLGLALLSQYIGLAAIIGAFLAGMVFADNAWEWGLEQKVESLNVFLVSFFFVNVGLNVDLSSVTGQVLLLAVIIILIAILSKYVGCFTGAKLADKEMDRTSANIIGIGMVPRGEVGIIVASIGLGLGASVFSRDLYTVVVLMSVITTIIAPVFLSRAFRKKYPGEYCLTADDKI